MSIIHRRRIVNERTKARRAAEAAADVVETLPVEVPAVVVKRPAKKKARRK